VLPEPGEFEREGFRDETPNPPFMGQSDWLGSLGGLTGLVDTGLFSEVIQIEAPPVFGASERVTGAPEPFAPSSLEAFSLDDGPGTVDHAKALAALEEENRRLKSQVEEIYAERQRKVMLFREVISGGVYWLLSKFEPGTLHNTHTSKPVAASSDWILKSAQDLAGRLKQPTTTAQQVRTEFPKTGEAF